MYTSHLRAAFQISEVAMLVIEMLSLVYCVTEQPSQENNPSETLLRIMFAALHNVKILAPALPAVARGTVLKYAY